MKKEARLIATELENMKKVGGLGHFIVVLEGQLEGFRAPGASACGVEKHHAIVDDQRD